MRTYHFAAGFAALALAGMPARAEDDELAVALAAIGVANIEGKTEVGTGGGEIETAIMTAELMNDIVKTTCDDLGCTGMNGVLILGDSDLIDLQSYLLVRRRSAFLSAELGGLKCLAGSGVALQDGTFATFSRLAGAALRKDETVTGIASSASERLLANQFAATLGARAVFPGYGVGSADSELQTQWNAIDKAATELTVQSAKGKPCEKSDEAKAALALHTDIRKQLFTGDNPVIDKALAVEPVAARLLAGDLAILRFKIEKAGGTLIKSRSLLTQLGAPALTLSTGLVVSYRFTDKSQNTSGGGVMICRSGAKKLHSITRPRKAEPEADFGRCQLLAGE